jgi:streptomycin 6-kinase
MSRADKPDSRHADSDWPQQPVSAHQQSNQQTEPRARFAGAILLLWVVAFVGISAIWWRFA